MAVEWLYVGGMLLCLAGILGGVACLTIALAPEEWFPGE